ncbi:NAD-dependent protein deacylase [Aliiglaciecola sp. 3_MG-2023]|uniref:Sir2 family NAD+-dependent deacetylase n=1 Tax=Aliiglaciecola sp. 3_MG-2023 TaxID=3062644 RepID=UPI0026E19CBB|nr:Sir2 family NAD+-dependent deacetylase [Aliiglaciecola sp. 3_MG-2023]MDO6692587.1 NAD-dependent protein deacylase [Aliiglaciecola sp. 3_MG-2023]
MFEGFSKSSKVVVLTGAGISAESGLKTFRDNDGLWEKHRVEDVATPEAFVRNPDLVYRFYNQRRAQLQSPDIAPNKGHLALVELEKYLADNFLLITQNVDDLHERAGSKRVLHMHGELLSYRCMGSQKVSQTKEQYDQNSQCECCQQPSMIRPNIVWFGEMPLYMDEISDALSKADIFISVGTSGNVYPAAGFVEQASFHGAHCVELNLEPSNGFTAFSESHYGPATNVIPNYIASLIK